MTTEQIYMTSPILVQCSISVQCSILQLNTHKINAFIIFGFINTEDYQKVSKTSKFNASKI